MSKTVICPGSFDPVTCGHLDIIKRASGMFDKVVVAVLVNSSKTPTFTTEERIDLLQQATAGLRNVEIVSFEGLLAGYCKNSGIDTIVKGLRAVSDFEYSTFLSSSMVREIGSMGGDIRNFVPACVHERIAAKLRNR